MSFKNTFVNSVDLFIFPEKPTKDSIFRAVNGLYYLIELEEILSPRSCNSNLATNYSGKPGADNLRLVISSSAMLNTCSDACSQSYQVPCNSRVTHAFGPILSLTRIIERTNNVLRIRYERTRWNIFPTILQSSTLPFPDFKKTVFHAFLHISLHKKYVRTTVYSP